MRLEFRFNSARAHKTPAAKRFKNGEQARPDKNQSEPQDVIARDDDARDEANCADDAAREASVAVEVGFEEPAHGKNLTRGTQKAKSCLRRTAGAYLPANG